MSININSLKRHLEVSKSLDIDDLRERLDWADRDPTVEEAMLFTDREVAYFLRVSPRTVSRFVERGELRPIYLTSPNRTRRFTLSDMKAFLRRKIDNSY